MSRKAIAIARIILNIQLNHLVFVAAAVSVLGMLVWPESYILLWLAASIVPMFLYYWRVKTKKIVWFFAGLLAVLVIGVILPLEVVPKLLLIGMTVVYCGLTIHAKMKENPEKIELLSPFVFVVGIGAMAFKKHIYVSVCLVLAWVYLVGYFVYHFTTEYLKFVTIHEKSASNMPEKELFFQGVKQVGVFTGLSIVLASLMSNTNWLSKIISTLGDWVITFLRYIFAGIAGAVQEESAPPEQPIIDAGQDTMFEPVEYSELWLFIQKILEIVYDIIVFVLIIIILYYGIRSVIQFVKHNFTKVGKKAEAKTILSNQDIRESCREEGFKKEKRSLLGFLNSEQRIRTMYKKRVLQEKEKIVGEKVQQELSYLTAKECCEKIGASSLKEVYEKVRYSSEKVTSEDVRRAKE